ncbi:hypothetical protein L598_000700000170 [Mesorhizobium sp. J18]|uniref:hypothetical protein n=1 Tax=Mesorhizobium sp. J18 TaxID=935263 RepID=UPI001199075A|nr:hypothetical protein [Mesorhizobium sp. J18]TWG90261.1 hypothetical protein L598_000700000170 [Mesorhizobium sp. J18]
MPEETDNRPETIVPANDNHRPGPEGGKDADADIAPWQKLDKAVLSLARLIGRQIAREQFEALQAANDNKAPAGEAEGRNQDGEPEQD